MRVAAPRRLRLRLGAADRQLGENRRRGAGLTRRNRLVHERAQAYQVGQTVKIAGRRGGEHGIGGIRRRAGPGVRLVGVPARSRSGVPRRAVRRGWPGAAHQRPDRASSASSARTGRPARPDRAGRRWRDGRGDERGEIAPDSSSSVVSRSHWLPSVAGKHLPGEGWRRCWYVTRVCGSSMS